MRDTGQATVFIVDDDAAIRDSLSLLLGLRGYRCALFADAESFLTAFQAGWSGCVIADLRMPGMSGLELQETLRRRGHPLPFIIITAHGDVAATRTAFKLDAVDFLEKPFDDDSLIAAIDAAFARESRRIDARAEQVRREQALSVLTPRELEVVELIVQGLHNRDIAARLGISARTVEVHKARIMDKLGARGLADLIRLFAPARG